ncbi:MAG TPA: hypothetical protein VEJ63_05885 [Planctomycetota bacterium]|nr:hypothetical protein [Planctomycetota bacterium]
MDGQQPTTELTEPSAVYERLHTLERIAWDRRAEAAIKTLAPIFAPRFVSLRYLDAYHAHLSLINEDGSAGVDVGPIALEEP